VHTVMFAAAGERLEISPSLVQPRNLRRGRGPRRAMAFRQEARPLRHEGRAGALIPVVRVAGARMSARPPSAARRPCGVRQGARKAADHHAIAARDKHQPVRVLCLEARPGANRRRGGAARARRSGATRIDDELAVGQQQGLAAPCVEVAALEQEPQQPDVEPHEASTGQAPSSIIGSRSAGWPRWRRGSAT